MIYKVAHIASVATPLTLSGFLVSVLVMNLLATLLQFYQTLVIRSSLHGKGLNRFWSNVEAYLGPLLILISATSGDANEDCTNSRKWVVGALIHQGFENRDMFYGTSGTLYAIDPVFHMCSPSGM